jgi:hypothetical protein
MTAPLSEGSLRLQTYAWRALEGLRDRLVYAGYPAPLDLLADVIEADVKPADTHDDVSELHTLALAEVRAVRVTADLFDEPAIQRAMREALDVLRAEHRLGHAGP